MKKIITLFLMSFLLIGMLMSTSFVLAHGGSHEDEKKSPNSIITGNPIDNETEKNETEDIEKKGTIEFVNIEGGCWRIVTEEGKNYEPVNLPSRFQEDGIKVEFEGTLAEDRVSTCQVGTLIDISDIEREDRNKSDEDENETEKRENKLKIRIRNRVAKVELEFNGTKTEFELRASEREQVLEELENRYGITEEQLQNFEEFEFEKKTKTIRNGREIEIEIEEESENGVVVKRKLKIENETVETELEIEEEFEGNETRLRTRLSNGERAELRILPDEAKGIVERRLEIRKMNFDNSSNITLEEIKHRNIPRVVYNIDTNQNGRFLGVFKLKMRTEAQVDAENGEVVRVNKPWWAFLVSLPEDEEIEENETEENDTEESEENETENNETINSS